jgi:hypothetical protein
MLPVALKPLLERLPPRVLIGRPKLGAIGHVHSVQVRTLPGRIRTRPEVRELETLVNVAARYSRARA